MADKKDSKLEGKYMGSVKVGPKGQIVIPKEVRDMYGIAPGDTLLLLADVSQGIAIQRYDYYEHFFQQVFRTQGGQAPEDDQ